MQAEIQRPPLQRGAVKPLSAERFSVNFTADAAFRDLLEEVRALLSHAEPKGDLMHVMKRGLEALRTELLKKASAKPATRPRRGQEAAARPNETEIEGAKGRFGSR
jgi:hypothetical protein